METYSVGTEIYIHAGYYAGCNGTIEANYPEKNGYSVYVHGERTALIKYTDCVKA